MKRTLGYCLIILGTVKAETFSVRCVGKEWSVYCTKKLPVQTKGNTISFCKKGVLPPTLGEQASCDRKLTFLTQVVTVSPTDGSGSQSAIWLLGNWCEGNEGTRERPAAPAAPGHQTLGMQQDLCINKTLSSRRD